MCALVFFFYFSLILYMGQETGDGLQKKRMLESEKPFVGKLKMESGGQVFIGFEEVEHVTSCPAFGIWPVVLSRYY